MRIKLVGPRVLKPPSFSPSVNQRAVLGGVRSPPGPAKSSAVLNIIFFPPRNKKAASAATSLAGVEPALPVGTKKQPSSDDCHLSASELTKT